MRDLENLKRSGQLGVKVNIVAQGAGQPKVVFKHIKCLWVSEMFYGSKLFFQGCKAQGANLLAQKSDVKVVKKRFGWLDADIILEKYVKEDVQLFE